jgi:apolipoprotein D and lipocalin family protein
MLISNRLWHRVTTVLLFAVLAGCGVSPQKVTVPVVAAVDLQRFMGPWYVIGVIPTFIEKDIYNAIETYELASDGTIRTTFTFNKGALDGPAKEMNPRGFVIPGTNNAIWGMQFIWPIKAEYVISYLNDNYTETIIARSARDYVWIMARSPNMSAERYAELTAKVAEMGYDIGKLVKIEHRPVPMPTPAEVAAILSGIDSISPAALRERLQGNAAPVVLDVRTAEEFAAGHVPGAINVPHAVVAADPAAAVSLARDADIVLYCGTGRRASVAVKALQSAGYSRLTHMTGDYPAWAAETAGK